MQISKQTDVVPSSFSVSLQTIDDEDEEIDEPNCPCTIGDSSDEIKVIYQLPAQRLWKYLLYANNCTNESLTSQNSILSKFLSYIIKLESLTELQLKCFLVYITLL